MTSEFPAQMASNAENVSIHWRHPVVTIDFSQRPENLFPHHRYNAPAIQFDFIAISLTLYFKFIFGKIMSAENCWCRISLVRLATKACVDQSNEITTLTTESLVNYEGLVKVN